MTNPLTYIPQRVRVRLYLLYAVLGPVLLYTAAKGWSGEAEYTLYTGLGIALGLVAVSNVGVPEPAARHSGDSLEPVELELVDESGVAGVELLYIIAAFLVIVVCLVYLL